MIDVDGLIEKLQIAAAPGGLRVKMNPQFIRTLCALCKGKLEADHVLLRIAGPTVVIGDIHGQFSDLIAGFIGAGVISDELQLVVEGNLLFLGDYIDRGWQGLEVVCFLFALKVRYPERVFLLRGNHEIRETNAVNGFMWELRNRYEAEEAEELFNLINDAFQWLPVAAVLDDSVFCVHAGIGPDALRVGLRGIATVDRAAPLADTGLVWDLLWADPDRSVEGFSPNAMRLTSVRFGRTAAEQFLAENGLTRLVRSHEEVPQGWGYPFGEWPSVMAVFSAPNYAQLGNRAALLIFDGRGGSTVHVWGGRSAEVCPCCRVT